MDDGRSARPYCVGTGRGRFTERSPRCFRRKGGLVPLCVNLYRSLVSVCVSDPWRCMLGVKASGLVRCLHTATVVQLLSLKSHLSVLMADPGVSSVVPPTTPTSQRSLGSDSPRRALTVLRCKTPPGPHRGRVGTSEAVPLSRFTVGQTWTPRNTPYK